ncbi:MAG: hypothetical protein BWX95_02598 [Bacteroidetes bacterium ADurb.Bin141]|nr:MAG: hypothetical protein BWX95_02598 [Bacteroidetes bacterium ADurb.Bin141]
MIHEQLPPAFTLVSSSVSFPYTNINFPADTCLNYTVTGFYTAAGSCPDSALTNRATLQTATVNYADSVCVNVTYPCTDSATFIIPPNTHSTTLAYRYDELNIYIAGTLYVDDTLKFMRCTVYVDEKAQIIVLDSGYFDIDSSTVMGCNTLWRGITVRDLGSLKVQEGSTVADADTTILAHDKAKVNIHNAYFRNFVLGVYIPPKVGAYYNGTTLSVVQATFEFTAFKPNYTGQNAHGSKSQCGILLNDWIGTIGGGTQIFELNYFNNLHTGVVGIGSILTVKRSYFKNIYYDTFYNEPYRGAAITNVKGNSQNAASLKVMPEVWNYITVDSSYRGIYTDRSVLDVNYVHLLNVRTGVEQMNAPTLSTNTVSNCIITASHIGIKMVGNPFARFMYATNNDITINGISGTGFGLANYGIWMSEGNSATFVRYTASNNNITLNNALHAIYAGALNTAKIKYNVIKLNSVANSNGISVAANQNSTISCNTVTGTYSSGITGSTSGISAGNMNNKVTMYCNTVDSTYRGFNFGGANPNTVFRGNEMNNHFNGLFLNSTATMGTQPHHGNEWFGPFGSFGAINLNINFVALAASEFKVDSTLGTIYNPIVNPSNGWFTNDTTGNTFYCSYSTVCSSLPPALTNDEYNAMIANGTLESEEYIDESRAMAVEYLYRELADDSTLWVNDSTYIQFMLENQGEPVAYLYNAEEYMRAAYQHDSAFMSLADSCNLQITLFTDSIEELYDLGWGEQAEQLIYTIGILNQTINNLNIVREATLNDHLNEAELQNEYVVNGELPATNTAYINEIEIEYLERGNDIQFLIDNYSSILAVAQQCPFAGGAAVERARSFIALVNDSVYYDDLNICLQSGIYRFSKHDSLNIKDGNSITVKPNPANDKVEIKLIGKFEGLCKTEFINAFGQTSLVEEMNCSETLKSINVSSLQQGIYIIKVYINNQISLINKVAIIR